MQDISRFGTLSARILLSLVFLSSGAMKIAAWSMIVGVAASKGLPLPAFSIGVAAAIEIIGALFLMSGFRARLAAFVLFLYLIPTTLIFHNFWAVQGVEHQMQMVNFMKNLAIMGGLLMVASKGPGPISIGKQAANPC
jgi:putative oxidoreductase